MNAASNTTVNHQQCEALMPGYINGELSGELSRAMQEHIARCPDCARQQSEAQQIKEALQQNPEPLDDLLRASIRNKNLQSVLSRIDKEDTQANQTSVTTKAKNTPTVSAIIQSIADYWQTMPWSLKGAFYAQSIALMVFAGLYFTQPNSATVSEYQTYTDSSTQVASAANTAMPYQVFRVIFHPKANEENVRQLLLDLDAQITGGPSLSGVYTLATGVNTEQSQLLHSMRSSPWIELAEPVIYFNAADSTQDNQ